MAFRSFDLCLSFERYAQVIANQVPGNNNLNAD